MLSLGHNKAKKYSCVYYSNCRAPQQHLASATMPDQHATTQVVTPPWALALLLQVEDEQFFQPQVNFRSTHDTEIAHQYDLLRDDQQQQQILESAIAIIPYISEKVGDHDNEDQASYWSLYPTISTPSLTYNYGEYKLAHGKALTAKKATDLHEALFAQKPTPPCDNPNKIFCNTLKRFGTEGCTLPQVHKNVTARFAADAQQLPKDAFSAMFCEVHKLLQQHVGVHIGLIDGLLRTVSHHLCFAQRKPIPR